MKLLEQWYAYLTFCTGAPIGAPACRAFWTLIMVLSLAIGALFVIRIAWDFISYKLKVRAALRAQQMREALADDETMERHRWTGDRAHGEDDRNAEVRIRSAIAARRTRNMGPTV